MEGTTSSLPSTPACQARSAAVGEDSTFIAFLKLQQLLADSSYLTGELSAHYPRLNTSRSSSDPP